MNHKLSLQINSTKTSKKSRYRNECMEEDIT